jgi:hypothetical protein
MIISDMFILNKIFVPMKVLQINVFLKNPEAVVLLLPSPMP